MTSASSPGPSAEIARDATGRQPGAGQAPGGKQTAQPDVRGRRPRVDLQHHDLAARRFPEKSTPTKPRRPGTDSTASRSGASASGQRTGICPPR